MAYLRGLARCVEPPATFASDMQSVSASWRHEMFLEALDRCSARCYAPIAAVALARRRSFTAAPRPARARPDSAAAVAARRPLSGGLLAPARRPRGGPVFQSGLSLSSSLRGVLSAIVSRQGRAQFPGAARDTPDNVRTNRPSRDEYPETVTYRQRRLMVPRRSVFLATHRLTKRPPDGA